MWGYFESKGLCVCVFNEAWATWNVPSIKLELFFYDFLLLVLCKFWVLVFKFYSYTIHKFQQQWGIGWIYGQFLCGFCEIVNDLNSGFSHFRPNARLGSQHNGFHRAQFYGLPTRYLGKLHDINLADDTLFRVHFMCAE